MSVKDQFISQKIIPETCTIPDDEFSRRMWDLTMEDCEICWRCNNDRSICKGSPKVYKFKRKESPGCLGKMRDRILAMDDAAFMINDALEGLSLEEILIVLIEKVPLMPETIKYLLTRHKAQILDSRSET
jgi:hypothetical protein